MAMSARLAPDHQIIPHALEVLRLMHTCMEAEQSVDYNELRAVLSFLKEAAECDKVRSFLKELTESPEWTSGAILGDLTQLYLDRHGDMFFDRTRFRLKQAPSIEFSRLLFRLEAKYIDPHCV
jgi:hypothetical protein